MNRTVIALLALIPIAYSNPVNAAPVEVYKDSSGQSKSVKLVSTLTSAGTPYAYSYKDNKGIWRPVDVISEICGVDSNGHPIQCANTNSSAINVPGGLAQISSDGSLSYPIETSKITLNYNGETFGSFFGNDQDAWTPHTMVRLGGTDTGRPMSLEVNGLPDGPNDSGTVLAVGATDGPFTSLRPAIGPDALSVGNVLPIANYETLDGAVVTNQTDTPVPLVRAGADIKDWEGNTHTVTFGCSNNAKRICFSPALPNEWVALLHRGENILTNVIGPGPTAATGNAFQTPNVLASQIDAIDPAGTYVDTLGWAVPGSGISNGFVPMTSSYAGDSTHPAVSAGTLDGKWSQYSHPAVFFGAITSMFSNYGYCKFNHTGQHDATHNINAADSMMHVCTLQQFDVFNSDADYTNSFGGWGIAYQGPGKPSSDSQMVWLSGGVPTYNRYRYVDQGTRLFDTTAGFNVDYPLPLPTDGTTGTNSARFMQGNEVQISGIAIKTQLWGQVDTSLPASPSTTDYVNSVSVHIGANWGTGPNTHAVDANNLGQLILNAVCNGVAGSVALAGGGSGPYAPNIGICVQPSGAVVFPRGLQQQFLELSSASVNTSQILSGQGTVAGWNLTSGRGSTDIVNVNPGGVVGGFRFYDTATGSAAISGTALLDISQGAGAQFSVSAHANGYGATNTTKTLAGLKAENSHYISEQVWCSDCLNDGQTTGNGTGRWIFLDRAYSWRSQDGKIAAN